MFGSRIWLLFTLFLSFAFAGHLDAQYPKPRNNRKKNQTPIGVLPTKKNRVEETAARNRHGFQPDWRNNFDRMGGLTGPDRYHCSNCKAQVSYSSSKCPHCGCRFKNSIPMTEAQLKREQEREKTMRTARAKRTLIRIATMFVLLGMTSVAGVIFFIHREKITAAFANRNNHSNG